MMRREKGLIKGVEGHNYLLEHCVGRWDLSPRGIFDYQIEILTNL